MCSNELGPNAFHILTASEGSMPYRERLSIICRMPPTHRNSELIFNALSSVMPFIEQSRIGSFSIILSEFSPKEATIFFAVPGPMPLTAPDDRYFSMSADVSGSACSNASAWNCSP